MTCKVTVDMRTGAVCGQPALVEPTPEDPVAMCRDHLIRWNTGDPHLLVFDVSTVETKDHEPLGEDVSRHCMSSVYMHGDGRGCRFHVRLDAWVFPGEEPSRGSGWFRCLRTGHPPIEDLLKRVTRTVVK